MSLSSDLISQFVEVTNDKVETKSETTVYGKIVNHEGLKYVKLDGSDLLTPISLTASASDGERVTVMIKNHMATVTGNISSPAVGSGTIENIGDIITEVEILVADKVDTKIFNAEVARIDNLTADNVTIKQKLTASEADISELKADNVEISCKLTASEAEIDSIKTHKLDADDARITYATIENLSATNANVHNLTADYGDFKVLATNKFTAQEAIIEDLDTKKLSAEDAEIKYANIDFTNIGKAALEEFFAKSGLIDNVIVGDGTITGELVGVTIKGDLIEGGTVIADKLVIKGTDGIYYKLNTDGVKTEAEQTEYNSINGSVILAKSITATKINVSDLVAFDATIGGFKITDSSLYSGVKSTATNTTRGIYMGDDGQIAFGDGNSFIKYYKQIDGSYKLDISAGNLTLGANKKNIETILDEASSSAQEAKDDTTALKTRMSSAETKITQNTGAIELRATKVEVKDIQESVDESQATADSNESRITVSESVIKQLSDAMSMLVTDENGNSMMTQTSKGWAFNMGSIENTLGKAVSELNGMVGSMNEIDSTISNLNSLVTDLSMKTAYIVMTTDDDGSPCIELGKVGNAFKLRITNTSVDFMEGSSKIAYVNNKSLYIERAIIKDELQIGEGSGFIWKKRSNGNMGLRWIGG